MAYDRQLRRCESCGKHVIVNCYHCSVSRTAFKGCEMVTLSAGDLVALTIALTSSLIVIATTAIANYRLTESRNYWRDIAIDYQNEVI